MIKNMKTEAENRKFLFVIYSKNGNLVSIETIKKMLDDESISGEELEKIRDGFRYLSEVIVDKYISEKDKNFDISEIPLKIESNEIINS
jgi:hypothetical protein